LTISLVTPYFESKERICGQNRLNEKKEIGYLIFYWPIQNQRKREREREKEGRKKN
jgi:hypothetical protein